MGMGNLGMDIDEPKLSSTAALLQTLTQLYKVALHLRRFREVEKNSDHLECDELETLQTFNPKYEKLSSV
jgi:hypothetical protein